MRKLVPISHKSFQLMVCLSTLSHLISRLCFTCAPLRLLCSSSVTFHPAQSHFIHVRCGPPCHCGGEQILPAAQSSYPSTSLLLPRLGQQLELLCLDSARVISSLNLVHLYSSVRQERGSRSVSVWDP